MIPLKKLEMQGAKFYRNETCLVDIEKPDFQAAIYYSIAADNVL